MPTPIPSESPTRAEDARGGLVGLVAAPLGALGIVYGDIGTSPLYAMKECFVHLRPTPDNVLGVLSLIVWSLTFVISVKYLVFILRADNDGEGGIFALLALVRRRKGATSTLRAATTTLLAVIGAGLLFGDGIITPSISVLSALEGLVVGFPASERFVAPLSIAVLVALFLVQRRGTAQIARFFGPITLAWFVVLGLTGVAGIVRAPEVLWAVSPHHAVRFLVVERRIALVVLGAVVLVVTGGEALYADMGHFTRSAIRRAWFAVVFPALLLNYFGQGALVLRDPSAVANPCYQLVPRELLVPMVLLATAATVIASQALISGAFSLARQAIRLDFVPRMRILHTSETAEGQIYLPAINWTLLFLCVATVAIAGSSTKLAAAYGLAVTANMAITSILFFEVAVGNWGADRRRTAALVAAFLVFDVVFLVANALKILDGGWFPVGVAMLVVTAMTTWRRGRNVLGRRSSSDRSLGDALRAFDEQPPARVPGTAVFMTASPEGLPYVVRHHLAHIGVLHEDVVMLTVITEDVPRVRSSLQIQVEALAHRFWRLTVRAGFMETPVVPDFLRRARSYGLQCDQEKVTYFLARESIVTNGRVRTMATWRVRLYAFMTRNAHSATSFYGIPPKQVVEYGVQVRL